MNRGKDRQTKIRTDRRKKGKKEDGQGNRCKDRQKKGKKGRGYSTVTTPRLVSREMRVSSLETRLSSCENH